MGHRTIEGREYRRGGQWPVAGTSVKASES
jgi:hypothetical protein